MAVTGQPKDPDEALLAGRPLMFVGEDEQEGSCLALGHPENIVLRVHQEEDDGSELADRIFADDVKERWNLHHDLVAEVAALKTTVRELLPLAQERASQFREGANKLAAFAKGTGVSPSDAVAATLKLRETVASAAEASVQKAEQVLKGICGTYQQQGEDPRDHNLWYRCDGCGGVTSSPPADRVHRPGEARRAP